VTSLGTASVKQLSLPLAVPEDEARVGLRRMEAPVCLPNLLERALERSNMFRALRASSPQSGCPGRGRDDRRRAPRVPENTLAGDP
jgi:hypothetical protein